MQKHMGKSSCNSFPSKFVCNCQSKPSVGVASHYRAVETTTPRMKKDIQLKKTIMAQNMENKTIMMGYAKATIFYVNFT